MASKPATVADASTEDKRPPSRFTDSSLSTITSLKDAVALAARIHGSVEEIDGFRVASDADKMSMVGAPMVLMEWDFLPGDFAKEYVTIRVVAEIEGKVRKFLLTDSGSGIPVELRRYTDFTGRHGGLTVLNGLRVSRYPVDPHTRKPLSKAEQAAFRNSEEKMPMASTYYLDLPKNDDTPTGDEPQY